MLHKEILTLVLCLSVPQYCGYAEWVQISQNGYRKGFTPQTIPNSSDNKPTTHFPAVTFPERHPEITHETHSPAFYQGTFDPGFNHQLNRGTYNPGFSHGTRDTDFRHKIQNPGTEHRQPNPDLDNVALGVDHKILHSGFKHDSPDPGRGTYNPVLSRGTQYNKGIYDNVTLSHSQTKKKPILQRIKLGSVEKVDLEPEVTLIQKRKEPGEAVHSNITNNAIVKPSPNDVIVGLNLENNHDIIHNIPKIKLNNAEIIQNYPTQESEMSTTENIVKYDELKVGDKHILKLNNSETNVFSDEEFTNSSMKNIGKFEKVSTNEGNAEAEKVDKAKNSHLNTLAAVIKVLKLVQDAISKSSQNSINSKMKYLKELRNTIMFSIEDRIEALWPAEPSAPAEGRSRASRSSKGDQVDFPSAESALMSISFLTFAVFLIKLVMQVIQTYKSKTMMVTPVFTNMGRAILTRTPK